MAVDAHREREAREEVRWRTFHGPRTRRMWGEEIFHRRRRRERRRSGGPSIDSAGAGMGGVEAADLPLTARAQEWEELKPWTFH